MQRRSPFAVATTLAVILAACGGGTPTPLDPDTPATDVPGASQPPSGPSADGTLTVTSELVAGPTFQVSEALASAGEPVRVAGALFVDADGRMLLCEAIAESFPPQCGGERLEVIGLDLGDVADLQEANGVRWAESVELSGTVSAGGGA